MEELRCLTYFGRDQESLHILSMDTTFIFYNFLLLEGIYNSEGRLPLEEREEDLGFSYLNSHAQDSNQHLMHVNERIQVGMVHLAVAVAVSVHLGAVAAAVSVLSLYTMKYQQTYGRRGENQSNINHNLYYIFVPYNVSFNFEIVYLRKPQKGFF